MSDMRKTHWPDGTPIVWMPLPPKNEAAMTPVELEAALDRTLRGDQGAAQGIIEHNKRLELINYDYRIGNTSLTASCHSFDMQVAELTWKLELRTQELDRIVQEQSHTYAVEMPDLQQQLTQAKQERDKARQIVARVNNDVIGSEGYFVEPSCVDAIEALKSHSNRLQQQLATVTQERNAFGKSLNQYGSHFRHCLGIAKCECGLDAEITTPNYLDLNCDLQQQLAQAKQDLADLPTLRKDLSMCLIQLQEARGSILSMESEVDMVRAQLDARRT